MYTLIIARGYPTEKTPGYGIFEFDQAKALAANGCKVVYAALDIRSFRHKRKWGIQFLTKDDIPIVVINIPLGRIPSTFLHAIASIGLKILYRRVLKKYGRPDVLHAHFPDYALVATKLKKKTGIPLIVTEHSSEIIKPSLVKNLDALLHKTYPGADAIIAVSPALAHVITHKYRHAAVYIPNMVDIATFTYEPHISNSSFRFVSVGNLIYRKRTDLTIEAFAHAFASFPQVSLTIFGEGDERPKLEKMIVDLGLSKKVFLRGLKKRQEIAKEFQQSDCFVLASQAETFGVAYIEAMACGLPVIATQCGGVDAFLHTQNGILVPVDDREPLTAAMKYMYTHARDFNHAEISQEIHTLFSPENVARQIMEVYSSVLRV